MQVAAASPVNAADAPAATSAPSPHAAVGGFGEVLSCLNPLQYLPVVGTIYRAVTGDTIPDGVREAGSLVFSGLTGGPVGVAMSLATDLAERVTGIDEEAVGRRLLAMVGIGRPARGSAAAQPHAVVGAVSFVGDAPTASGTASGADAPFAPALIRAAAPTGAADDLNGLELRRIAALAAYGRSAALAA